MSFGALILMQEKPHSNTFVELESTLQDAITEVRVEQHLDKQTSFAIRFQEDFDDTGAAEDIQRTFAKSRGMVVCVTEGEPVGPLPAKLVCLIRGQIENVEFDVNIGGSGSWFEVRGQDTRTLINRSVTMIAEDGDSDAMLARLVEPATTEPPVIGPSFKHFPSEELSYRYRGTRLEAVYDLARKSNFSFWLTYEVVTLPSVPGGEGKYEVKVTAHVEPSPPRGQSSTPGGPPSFADLGLIPGAATAKLKILGDDQECETVVSFSSRVDNEAYSAATSYSQNIATGAKESNEEVGSEDAGLNPNAEDVATVGGKEGAALDWGEPQPRILEVGGVGDPEIALWQAYTAATEASWYVRAEALTSVHMLEQVLAPHDIVEVVGGGCGIAGKYQVSDVTHVINPAAHWMQLSLRSNSRNLEQRPETP